MKLTDIYNHDDEVMYNLLVQICEHNQLLEIPTSRIDHFKQFLARLLGSCYPYISSVMYVDCQSLFFKRHNVMKDTEETHEYCVETADILILHNPPDPVEYGEVNTSVYVNTLLETRGNPKRLQTTFLVGDEWNTYPAVQKLLTDRRLKRAVNELV